MTAASSGRQNLRALIRHNAPTVERRPPNRSRPSRVSGGTFENPSAVIVRGAQAFLLFFDFVLDGFGFRE